MSREKMLQARDLITAKQYDQARAILKTVNHPKATEWLDKLDTLQLSEELGDPFADLAARRNPAARSSNNHDAGRKLLQEAVTVFTNEDWDVKVQMQDMVQMEKKEGVDNTGAAMLTVLLGLLGTLLVIVFIAAAKTKRVTLQLLPDGRVTASGPDGSFDVTNADQAREWASAVKSGASYTMAIVFGLISTVV